MNRNWCLLFLVCLAVALVKSESSIEVDENGDEYDVKRFNIQGRQLNEGRSQCVVTRRKRSSYPNVIKPLEAAEDSNEDEDDDDVMANAPLGDAMFFYSPPAINLNGDDDDEDVEDDDDDDYEDGDGENTMNVNVNTKPMESNMNENNDEKINDDADEDITSDNEDDYEDDMNEDGPETIEVVQLQQLPVLGQLQSQGQSVAAIASASNHVGGFVGSHVGYGNTNHISNSQQQHGHTPTANGIMVVESHGPPKVNPNTHAVFELVQVNSEGIDANNNTNDYNDDDDDDYDIEEELEPVTTTAVWSTGSADDLYDDLHIKPIKPTKPSKVANTKPHRRPNKKNKKPTKRPLKPMRKHKKKKTNKNKKISGNKKKRLNNRIRPNRNGGHRRPLNKRKNNKKPKGNMTRRPVRRYVKKPRPDVYNSEKYDKKKTTTNGSRKNKNRRTNANKNDVAKKRKNKKNSLKKDQGAHTYTRTVTMTQTDGSNNDRDTNCIIIRKDPPPAPTTARPFWNLLGRSADGAAVGSSQYGKRKRANLRFKA